MEIERLRAFDAIDPEIEGEYKFITSVKTTYGIHCHDFYEIFLVTEGRIVHCINGRQEILNKGALVFIRPDDYHYYISAPDTDGEFINLSFLESTVNDLLNYLDKDFLMEKFLNPPMPPVVNLPISEFLNLKNKLDSLNLIPQKQKSIIRAHLRTLLVELFVKYFIDMQLSESETQPFWLKNLCAEIMLKENFSEGINALVRISGKSHAYLCRIFKKYLHKSPVDFINDIRLDYVENLLLNTDKSIIEACLEAGFDNVAHFYKLFKKRFGTSPKHYRRDNQKKFSV